MSIFISKHKSILAQFTVVLLAIILVLAMSSFATGQSSASIGQVANQDSEAETEDFIEVSNDLFAVPNRIETLVFDFDIDRHASLNHVVASYQCPPTPLSDEEFENMANFAKRYIGCPYLHEVQTTYEEEGPDGEIITVTSTSMEGFDCSGFALFVLRHCGSKMTAASCQQQWDSCYQLSEDMIKPGDLVFFTQTQSALAPETMSHVGIFLGDGKFIHSASSTGVVISSLDEEYWSQHFYGYGRPLL